MYDLIIVGGSVAGLSLACGCPDLKVLVVEEHKKIGGPVQCSGLYSPAISRFIPPASLGQMTVHTLNGAIIHGPAGAELQLKKKALVVDRQQLDLFFCSQCTAEVQEGKRVEAVQWKKDRVAVRVAGMSFEGRMVAGCDGPFSVVGQSLGAMPKETVPGLIAIASTPCTEDMAELWCDKDVLSDGFFWKIPRGQSAEYGMWGTGATFSKLEQFFHLTKYTKHAGAIPLGPPLTVFNRAILLGSAAAQAKPWSGGGVIYTLTAAEIAAKTISDCVQKGDFSKQALSPYERSWQQSFGRQIALGMKGREVFRRMGNSQLSSLFPLIGRLPLSRLDMDVPSCGFIEKMVRLL